MKLKDYLDQVFASYVKDPASSDWQRGYLAATLNVRDQCLDDPNEVVVPKEIEAQF